MWVGTQGPLGGVMTLPEQAKRAGAPPHWMAHVEVADVDATVAEVQRLGGKVHVPPEEVPTVGRFSVIGDPQGAVLSVFRPAEPMAPHDRGKPGEVCWHELYAVDDQKAFEFYARLFAWERISDMDMGPLGTYRIFGQAGVQYGGIMTKPPTMQAPPTWGYYFETRDLEVATERAAARGAKVLSGPREVPGGRVVQLIDPQGAYFALHSAAR